MTPLSASARSTQAISGAIPVWSLEFGFRLPGAVLQPKAPSRFALKSFVRNIVLGNHRACRLLGRWHISSQIEF